MRHVLNRVYITTDPLHIRDRKRLDASKIALVLCAESVTVPTSDGGIEFVTVDLPQAGEAFADLSTRIQTTIDAGQGVFVYAQNERDLLFLVVMAYLMDTAGMTFPNAYTRIVMGYAMLNVDVSPLISAYGLPYEQSAELHGNLIALSRTAVSPINDQLFISGIEALENPAKARAVGIDAVLRLDRGSNRAELQWADHYRLLDIPIHDGTLVSSELLRQGAAFIHRHVNAGDKVLVHCMMGMSRSVSFVLAYLVEYGGMSLADAYALIVRGRPIAQPHPALLQSVVQSYNLPVKDVWGYDFLDRLLVAANPLTLRR